MYFKEIEKEKIMFNINMEEASYFFSIVTMRIKRLIGKIWYQYQGNPGASRS